MTRCLITYEEIPDGTRYSAHGLRSLSPRLKDLQILPYSAEEQRQEAIARASKMSIQGVQPKLSCRLNVPTGAFQVVDVGGEYILKPQTTYPEVPQNEDLSMKLAVSIGVEIPLHGLLYSKDNSLTYFVKRFDRQGGKKIMVEDFAQLLGKTRDTKYDASMEQVVSTIDAHCTFPLIEKVKLFRLTLFNFLIGNEDMHLKNFSLIAREGKVQLSPAYDLVNTTIAIGDPSEEIALPIEGRQRNLSRSLLAEYFARDRLGLPSRVINDVLAEFTHAIGDWSGVIAISFLSVAAKKRYTDLLLERARRLQLAT